MQQTTTRRPRLLFALAAVTALVASPLGHSKTDPPLFVIDPSGVPAVLDGLDRNYEAILEVPEVLLEELPEPGSVAPRAAHKVWLIPDVAVTILEDSNGSTSFSSRTLVRVLNAGDTTAEVSCIYFDHNGALDLDLGTSESVSPAIRTECTPFTTRFNGWMLVLSDRPVLLSGHQEVRDYESAFKVGASRARDLAIYPIDCEQPEGIEFACQFVAP